MLPKIPSRYVSNDTFVMMICDAIRLNSELCTLFSKNTVKKTKTKQNNTIYQNISCAYEVVEGRWGEEEEIKRKREIF